MRRIVRLSCIVCLASCLPIPLQAGCPYDHLVIGCNEDGEPNTPDDRVLFLDTTQLYRRSDPNHQDQHTWLNWYYTLFPFGGDPGASTFVIGEPGFDTVSSGEDPNRCLTGIKNTDYRIIVECLDIRPGFKAGSLFGGDILLDEPGDTFNHSSQSDSHVHLYYTAPAPGNELYWIQYRVYDEFYNPADPNSGYLPSQSVTVVFGRNPSPGDMHVDGSVNLPDLEKLADRWLLQSDSPMRNARGQAAVDLFDRADINRDYRVDLYDLNEISTGWMK